MSSYMFDFTVPRHTRMYPVQEAPPAYPDGGFSQQQQFPPQQQYPPQQYPPQQPQVCAKTRNLTRILLVFMERCRFVLRLVPTHKVIVIYSLKKIL